MDIKAYIINRLLKRNYFLARIIYGAWFTIKFHRKKLLIVFQMGKVGSTSVVSSLQATKLNMPVLQVHAISQKGINDMEQRYYGDRRSILQGSLLPETKHLFLGHYLHSALRSNRNKPGWKLVTLVRDPVARNVSEFFYSVDTTKSEPYLYDFYNQYAANSITTEEIVQRFLEVFNEESLEFRLPLLWFDQEFAAATGIDVYASQFPREKGYMRYHAEGFDVLLLKLECLGQCSREAFKEFLELPDFHLLEANRASQKRYYPAYKEFIQSVRMPESYLSKVYNSKYVRHFYTDEEVESFWKKWGK
jgi:hypothetical protein